MENVFSEENRLSYLKGRILFTEDPSIYSDDFKAKVIDVENDKLKIIYSFDGDLINSENAEITRADLVFFHGEAAIPAQKNLFKPTHADSKSPVECRVTNVTD